MPVLKNQRHEKFARNVAKGMSATQAYIDAGYSAKGADVSASRLLGKASVRARVSALQERTTEKVMHLHIANKEHRLAEINTRWLLLQQVRAERALEMVKNGRPIVAGAGTGLLTRTFKSIGQGANAKVIPEFSVDTGLLAAQQRLEEFASREVGPPPPDNANAGIDLLLQLMRRGPANSPQAPISDNDEDDLDIA